MKAPESINLFVHDPLSTDQALTDLLQRAASAGALGDAFNTSSLTAGITAMTQQLSSLGITLGEEGLHGPARSERSLRH